MNGIFMTKYIHDECVSSDLGHGVDEVNDKHVNRKMFLGDSSERTKREKSHI